MGHLYLITFNCQSQAQAAAATLNRLLLPSRHRFPCCAVKVQQEWRAAPLFTNELGFICMQTGMAALARPVSKWQRSTVCVTTPIGINIVTVEETHYHWEQGVFSTFAAHVSSPCTANTAGTQRLSDVSVDEYFTHAKRFGL